MTKLQKDDLEGIIRRQGDGTFGAITLRGLSADTTVSVSAPSASAEGVRFQFDAANWRATLGPDVVWAEAHATGSATANFVEVKDFLLVGYFGSVKGTGYAAADRHWVVTGAASGANLDIEAVLKQGRDGDKGDSGAGRPTAAMGGIANFELLFSGSGDRLEQAAASATAAGPFRVRWATINGVNLGYVATRPGSLSGPGGVTRFTEVNGWMVAGPKGVLFQDLDARAGALSTRGQVMVSQDGRLSGALRRDGRGYCLTERGMYLWVLQMSAFFESVNVFREKMRANITSELERDDDVEDAAVALERITRWVDRGEEHSFLPR